MIRTSDEYRDSLLDGREIYIDGEPVEDVTTHPMFKPIVDVRARIYDLAHEEDTRETMTYVDPDTGDRNAVGLKPPVSREDWEDKRTAVNTVLDDIGGVVVRMGDETIGEMWSLADGEDVLNEVDPRFAANIRRHIERAVRENPFHVSANTDPKGGRSKRPQTRIPTCCCTSSTRPTAASSSAAPSTRPPQPTPTRRSPSRPSPTGATRSYPLASRFDEIDTLVICDDVRIPWEDVLFYRHTRAATFIRATLHRYSAFPYVQRVERIAVLLIGAALFNVRQTGLERQPDLHHARRRHVNEDWVAEDRRKLLAFARDLLNSDYAGHRLTFELFALSPPFAQLAAVYRAFDFDGPLDMVRKSAGLSDRVTGAQPAGARG